jgi:hypothetical protein
LRCSRNNLVISFWKGTGETSVPDIFHLSIFLSAETAESSKHAGICSLFVSSLHDDMDQRKTDLLESQLLIEELEQREQMLEAQIEMLQVPDNTCAAQGTFF